MNCFLPYRSYLLRPVAYGLAHYEPICGVQVFARLQFLVDRVELVHDPQVLELLRLLVVCLPSKD